MSIETAYEEEGMCVLEATPLTEDAGAAYSARVKLTCPEVLLGVLRDGQRFLEIDQGSIYKLDKL